MYHLSRSLSLYLTNIWTDHLEVSLFVGIVLQGSWVGSSDPKLTGTHVFVCWKRSLKLNMGIRSYCMDIVVCGVVMSKCPCSYSFSFFNISSSFWRTNRWTYAPTLSWKLAQFLQRWPDVSHKVGKHWVVREKLRDVTTYGTQQNKEV